jgi:hypothetical protein
MIETLLTVALIVAVIASSVSLCCIAIVIVKETFF